MEPIVNGLEEQYGNRIAFRWLDAANEGSALFQQYGLRGHPSYIILDTEGQVVWRFTGQTTREMLEEGIRDALQRDPATPATVVGGIASWFPLGFRVAILLQAGQPLKDVLMMVALSLRQGCERLAWRLGCTSHRLVISGPAS